MQLESAADSPDYSYIMTIETSNEHQRAFSDQQMAERVEWDDNQQAALDADLEQYLVDTYAAIRFVDSETEVSTEEAYTCDGAGGECSRPVDAPDEYCWQHADDDDTDVSLEEQDAAVVDAAAAADPATDE